LHGVRFPPRTRANDPGHADRSGGFIRLGVLAAIAIASVIVMASAALIHDVALFFDRGMRAMKRCDLRAARYALSPSAILLLLLASAAEPGAVARAEVQNQPSVAASNPVAAQSLEQLSTIVDRPLFSPSRRAPAPPPAPAPIVQAAEPPAPPLPPPNLVLFGVVMDGESARAVVRSGADKKMVRAQIGDEIDGWKVSQIEGRKVVLSLDGRFATFTLFSDDRGKSESVGGSAPVGEPKNTQRQMQAQQNSPQVAAAQSVQPKKRRRSRE
jgi:hypothetical protein